MVKKQWSIQNGGLHFTSNYVWCKIWLKPRQFICHFKAFLFILSPIIRLFSLHILIHIDTCTMKFSCIYNVFFEYNHISTTTFKLEVTKYGLVVYQISMVLSPIYYDLTAHSFLQLSGFHNYCRINTMTHMTLIIWTHHLIVLA